MKNRFYLNAAVISGIAIGVISFTGCKNQEVLMDRPMIPPPSAQDPASSAAATVPAKTVVPQPVPAPAVKAPVDTTVVPK